MPIKIVAFDLDGTLAESKQALQPPMCEALARLLTVCDVAIISGGDWPQFDKQIASRLPSSTNLFRLWMMPTTGTKLYRYRSPSTPSSEKVAGGGWTAIYADTFTPAEKTSILSAFDASLLSTGFTPSQTWGERIEDRGSQITFSALGQEAPWSAKKDWDPDFAKRTVIQKDLRGRLSDLSINMGGATSIDVTKKGVDKGTGLKKLSKESGVDLEDMLFIGDAIFPGGNDYPAKEIGVKTVCVRDPEGTLAAIEAIVACLS